MNPDSYSSRLLEAAVNEFSKLPGIGRKTALRLVLHLLRQDPQEVYSLGNSLIRLRDEIKHCKNCHSISDEEICNICTSPQRNSSLICVVESIRDVMAIENTRQFNGLYHVLGGIISPMEGVGPGDLSVESLEEKVAGGKVREVVLALSTTMEGDTTNFYLYRRLSKYPVDITAIARGIAIGDELEYADEVTLGRSIANRTIFNASFNNKE